MSDDVKLKRRFFQDLVTGRKIIAPANITHAKVKNAKAQDGADIAQL